MPTKKEEKELTPSEEPKDTTANNEEMVSVPKKDFESIINRLDQLEKSPGVMNVTKEVPQETRYRTAKVRFLDGNIVVGYGKAWDERTKDGNWVLKQEIITRDDKGKEKTTVVNAVEFRNEGEFEEAKIVDVKESYIVHNGGKIVRRVFDEKNEWNMVETGETVEMVTKTPDHTYVVRLDDGREIELKSNALN